MTHFARETCATPCALGANRRVHPGQMGGHSDGGLRLRTHCKPSKEGALGPSPSMSMVR
jgi:hypothetical protein